MIDPKIEQQFASAGSGSEVQSLMLQWTEVPQPALFTDAKDKRARLQVLADFYRVRKESALRNLAAEDNLTVRDLPNSGSIILTGPVSKLRTLVGKGSFLERLEGVEVLPNIQYQALASV